VINSIRAHLAEFGIIAPVGRKGVTETAACCCRPERQDGCLRLPARALPRSALQLLRLKQQILELIG